MEGDKGERNGEGGSVEAEEGRGGVRRVFKMLPNGGVGKERVGPLRGMWGNFGGWRRRDGGPVSIQFMISALMGCNEK